MAKKYWKDQDPLGQQIIIGKGLGPQFEEGPRQIVGIVGTVRENKLSEKEPGVMYVPASQVLDSVTQLVNGVIPLSWAVRVSGDPAGVRSAVERELRSVDGMITAGRVGTMESRISESMARQNFNMVLLSIFAGIALLLAAIGVYGLMSYSVEQRMQEIGIRVALGAGRRDVLALVVRQGMTLAAAGVGLGLAAAYGLTRLISSLLFGVKAQDPLTFGVVAVTVTLVAIVACLVPARRASAVDACDALRHQ
jgi:predicted lysophospholipase L1 biosynthesis ABC-type transport system permease subunit